MDDALVLRSSTRAWEEPTVKPLDEGRWQAWKANGRVRDQKDFQTRLKVLTGALIVALLAVVGFWSQLGPGEIVIRCLVAAGAVSLMAYAIGHRHYWSAAVFAALTILYNPFTPLVAFAGNWQRGFVLVSAVPFVASLTRRDLKGAYIG